MTHVEILRLAQKQLKKAPKHVAGKFYVWARAVARDGITRVRRISGYHDEPLKGNRLGQRSIRLNKQWRAIYTETEETITLEILEVTPHDY